MRANDLVRRAFQLINVPGQGGTLSDPVLTHGYDTLKELLASEAVSKMFVPGVRTHFFNLQSGKAIYSYGANSQCDFRSDDFDDDPAPVRIEDAYIRGGATITNNEQVDEYRFESAGTWSTTGVGDITNNSAYLDGIGTVSQSLGLTAGKTYTLRINIDVNAQDVVLQVQQNAVDILNFTLDASGIYEYDFAFTTTLPTITFTTDDADDDVQIFSCSIIERGKEQLELPDGQGSDYHMKVVDQLHYNRRHSKGSGGRPYELFYDRGYGKSTLKFDNSGVAGDILVMDVLVDRVTPARLTSELRIQPEAQKWLRYALADDLAGEHGKSLSNRQIAIMNEAWDKLASGNRRINMLGVDRALRRKPEWNINRGDP
jgi:hypothetical protein